MKNVFRWKSWQHIYEKDSVFLFLGMEQEIVCFRAINILENDLKYYRE